MGDVGRMQISSGGAWSSAPYVGGHAGNEWTRLILPTGASFGNQLLNLTTAPTKQTDAPSELSVHSGSGANVRISLDWEPPDEMAGWVFQPYVSTTKYPGRIVLPLGLWTPLLRAPVHFNNTANPNPFRGCAVAWSLDDENEYYRLDVYRMNSSVGLPANAVIRVYPWYGG